MKGDEDGAGLGDNDDAYYNPDATADGENGNGKVVTKEGGQTEVKNGDSIENVEIDSVWTGKGEHVFGQEADTVKGEVIVDGKKQMVVKKIIEKDV